MSNGNDIGGHAAEYTPRGFAVYGRVIDGQGGVVRVQRSSAMGEPRCRIFVNDSAGREFVTGIAGHEGGIAVVAPHLNATEARALAALLVAFANDAEGQETDDADGSPATPPWGPLPTAAEVEAHVARSAPARPRSGAPWARKHGDTSGEGVSIVYLAVNYGRVQFRAPTGGVWYAVNAHDRAAMWRPVDADGVAVERGER